MRDPVQLQPYRLVMYCQDIPMYATSAGTFNSSTGAWTMGVNQWIGATLTITATVNAG
jgi:hypothetical protein